jgi:IS5 family transposase
MEHPFRVIKRQFGYAKVRYRGLKKNTAQLLTLFALSNLWRARGKLGERRHECVRKRGQYPAEGAKHPIERQ